MPVMILIGVMLDIDIEKAHLTPTHTEKHQTVYLLNFPSTSSDYSFHNSW